MKHTFISSKFLFLSISLLLIETLSIQSVEAQYAAASSYSSLDFSDQTNRSRIQNYNNEIIDLGKAAGFALLAKGDIITEVRLYSSGEISTTNENIIASENKFQNNNPKVREALNNIETLSDDIYSSPATAISSHLEGQSLSTGTYEIKYPVILDGTLTLTGDSSSVYIFKIFNSLTIKSNSFLNLGEVRSENVYWYVIDESQVMIEAQVNFSGIVIAKGNIISNCRNAGRLSLISTNGIISIFDKSLLSTTQFYSQEKQILFSNLVKHVGSDSELCSGIINPDKIKHDNSIPISIDRFNNPWIAPSGNNQNTDTRSINCEGFNVTFDDVVLNNGIGFDDPVFGEARRNCVCAVYTYIAGVIDLQSRTPNILITASQTDGTDNLAFASTFFNTAMSGYLGGTLYDHIVNGIPYPNNNNYGAYITVDFGTRIDNGFTINSTCGAPPLCPSTGNEYDLYSIILHEATHGLGFGTLIQADGSSSLGRYSKFDSFLKIGNMNLVNSHTMFNPSALAALTSNLVVFKGPNNTTIPSVYSPGSYKEGSSLSHVDDYRDNILYIMRPDAHGGPTQKWSQAEMDILVDLGYRMYNPDIYPSSTNDHYPVGVADYATTTLGTTKSINVLTNDIDVDNDLISIELNCGCMPAYAGTFTVSGRNIGFSPNPTFVGDACITYCPTDGKRVGAPTKVCFTVTNSCPNTPCNFICNGGFEYGNSCPTIRGEIPAGWKPTFHSTDYFSRNCNCIFGIPENIFAGPTSTECIRNAGCGGVQTWDWATNTTTNNKYIGMGFNNHPEGITTQLLQPLIPGKTYTVELRAITTPKFGEDPTITEIPGQLRIGFTTDLPVQHCHPIIPNNCDPAVFDFELLSAQIPLCDGTNNWTHVQISFTAPSAQINYITIIPIDVNPPGPGLGDGQYMFIDDVQLTPNDPPLTITKTVDNLTPKIGSTINYTITVCNPSISKPATGVEIQDILPPGLNYVGNQFSSYPTHTFAPIPANGGCVTVTLSALVNSTAPLTTNPQNPNVIKNCAEIIAGNNNCVTLFGDQNCAKITVPATDISISKDLYDDTVCIGNTFRYNVIITNTGLVNATGVLVNDELPAGATYASHVISSGTYNSTTGDIAIPNLNAGSTINLEITATATTPGNFTNCANLITLNQTEINLMNNESCSEDISVVSSSCPCVQPPAGLVAWWSLEDLHGATTVKELVGGPMSINTGIPVPGPVWDFNIPPPTPGVTGPCPASRTDLPGTGKVADALYFYRTGGTERRYIRVPSNPSITFSTSDMSIDAWIYISELNYGNFIQPIVEKMHYSGQSMIAGYRFYLKDSKLSFDAASGGVSGTVQMSTTLTHDVWHLVAITMNRSTGTVIFYIDGVAFPTNGLSVGDMFNNENLNIGGSLEPGVFQDTISIDELELFNRELSASDIQNIFNVGSSGKCKSGISDLYIKDNDIPPYFDSGIEPNTTELNMMWDIWNSNDIWVRNSNDGFTFTDYQTPEFSNTIPNFVYVKVTNKGFQSSLGNEQLNIHWAKMSTSESWPDNFNGLNFYSGGTCINPGPITGNTIPSPLSGNVRVKIGSAIPISTTSNNGYITIPVLDPGETAIVEIPWFPPNPVNYICIDPLLHFNPTTGYYPFPCFFSILARIQTTFSPNYGMTFPETAYLYSNVKNNNNIAWKSTMIVNDIYGKTGFMMGNFSSTQRVIKMQFDTSANSPFNKATVKTKLSTGLYQIWAAGGKQGNNILELSDSSIKLLSPGAYISNLTLGPNTDYAMSIEFNLLSTPLDSLPLLPEYNLAVVQYDQAINTIDGGISIAYKPVTTSKIKSIVEGFYYENGNRLSLRDTVKAYLRNNFSPFSIVDSAKAIIDSTTFTGDFPFVNAPSGTYYIQLKHRNSIETWSKPGGEVYVTGSGLIYDFTSTQTQAYGSNTKLKGSKYCIYSGDVNQDGVIDLTDISMIFNDAENFVYGYVVTDVTGDNITELSDIIITYNNALNFISTIRP